MLKDILMIVSGCVAGLVILYLKQVLTNYGKSAVANGTLPTEEKFNWKKLAAGFFDIINPVKWSKEIVGILNLRKLIIVAVIMGLLYGYGFWKGKQGVQPVLNWNDGEHHWVSLNEHYLHIYPGGTMDIVDHDKKTVIKKITVKDIPELRKALQSWGIDINPFITIGTGTSKGLEIGVGTDLFKWYKWHYSPYINNGGFFPIGISYKVTKNSGILFGAGIPFNKKESNEKAFNIGWKWDF